MSPTLAGILHLNGLRASKFVDMSPLEGKRVLVTGATGLIGRNLIAALECSACHIDYATRAPTQAPYPDPHKSTGISYGHVVGPHMPWAWDYIIHSAGSAQPSVFAKEPMRTLRVNTEDLRVLLGNRLSPEGRLLYLSSSEIYTGCTTAYPDEETPGATLPNHARGAYIEAKRCGEAICYASGRDIKIARVNSAYGPGSAVEDTRVVNQFMVSALRDGVVNVRDGGSAQRRWLYVSDCVEMLLNILLHGKSTTYNVAAAEGSSVRHLAGVIATMTGSKLFIGADNPIGPLTLLPNPKKYMDEFDNCPCTTLDEGLRMLKQWYQALGVKNEF